MKRISILIVTLLLATLFVSLLLAVVESDYAFLRGNFSKKAVTLSSDSPMSSEPPIVQWNKTYGGYDAYVGAWALIQTSDGGYAVVGKGSPNVVKTDDNGNLVWNSTCVGLTNNLNSIIEVSGGYVIAEEYSLFKIDYAGTIQWQKAYLGGMHHRCVCQAGDGGYVTVGFEGGDAVLIRTNSDGDMQWYKYYDRDADDHAYSVVHTNDGGYIIAGSTGPYFYYQRAWSIKTDSSGNAEWNRTYGYGFDELRSVVQTSDGGCAFAGYTESFADDDFLFIKTDSSGNPDWIRTYGSVGYVEYGYSVVQSTEGGYAIAGIFYGGAGVNEEVFLVRTDSNGDIMWSDKYGGTDSDGGHSVVQATDGGYAIAGYSGLGVTDQTFWLIKLYPEEIHDSAVTNITPYKTVAGKGYTININATFKNQGIPFESFNITFYTNATIVETFENITLQGGKSIMFTIIWNTTPFTKGNYTLSANVTILPTETNTINNKLIDGTVYVGIPGDITASFGQVDMKDIGTVVKAFGSVPGHPKWNPNADINNDGKVDMKDIGITVQHFGQTES